MHDGNVGRFRNAAFDFKTLGGFDVLEVDAAEGLRNVDHGVDEFLRVFGVHFDVKHVNTCEGLEQQPLAFHDGFAGQSADVSQAEHGRAVGNHGDQVTFGGVAVSVFWSLLNFQTGIGHTGRIGQTQLVSGGMRFGRYNLDFPLRFSLVILKRFLAQHPVFFAHGHGLPRKKGKKAGFDCCANPPCCLASFPVIGGNPNSLMVGERESSNPGKKTCDSAEHCTDSEGFPSNK